MENNILDAFVDRRKVWKSFKSYDVEVLGGAVPLLHSFQT